MKSHLCILPTLTLAFLTSCGCSQEPGERVESTPHETEAATTEAGTESSETSNDKPVLPINPFTTAQEYKHKPNLTLPDDPFFVEYRYPGTEVFDVQTVFNSPTAWFSSSDGFEKIDAFYAKLFTDSEGKVHGTPGRYFRLTEDGRRERATIKRRTGGGCEVIISK